MASEILEVLRAEEAVKKLTAAIQASRAAILKADQASQGRGPQFRQTVESETRAIRQNEKELARHEATLRKSEKAGRGFHGGMQGAAYGVLYLSQAVEDAQYGFHSILNNIPLIAMSLGAGPGLAGAASLAAVAVNQLGGDMLTLQRILEGTPLQGALGTGGKMPWSPGGWMREISEGFYKALGVDIKPGDAKRAEKNAREMEEVAKRRKAALDAVLDMQKGIGGTDMAAGMARAFQKSPLSGKDLLDRMLDAAGVGAEPKPGETADMTKRREDLKATLATRIELALKGVPAEMNELMKTLVDDQGKERFQGGRDLADLILNAVMPLQEDRFREQAANHMTRFAGLFERSMRALNPTLPGLTAKGRSALGAQLQGGMDSAGVTPEMQAIIAQMFTGKAGEKRAAALNTIVPMLMEAGATQREVYEALPRIFRDMDKGLDVFAATERAIMDLARGGMRQSLRRRSRRQQNIASGLGMLGIDASAFTGQTSRFFEPRRRAGNPDIHSNLDLGAVEGDGGGNVPGWGVIRPEMQAAYAADAARKARLAAVLAGAQPRMDALDALSAQRRAAALSGQPMPGVPPQTPPLPRAVREGRAAAGPRPFAFPTAGLSGAQRDALALGMLPTIPGVYTGPGQTDAGLWDQQDRRRGAMAQQGLFPGTHATPANAEAMRGAGLALTGGLLQGQQAVQAQVLVNQGLTAQVLTKLDRDLEKTRRLAESVQKQLQQVGRTAQNRGR